mmetsp:Transcript_42543/g.108098  ORF Transcript_42543/g.108098 Transcript_42543/m.108098 type:complete len:283 (+) Transcript_42543:280-1128(+)
MSVLNRGPLLDGAHLEAVRHCSHHEHHVPERGHQDVLLEQVLVELRAATLPVRCYEVIDVLPQVAPKLVKVCAIEGPPHFVTKRTSSEATPIDDAALQLASVVPPEVSVVCVQVVMPQCNVVHVVVQPILQFGAVRRPCHHGVHELVLESLRCDVLWEDNPCRFCDELDGLVQSVLQHCRRLSRSLRRIHAPDARIRGIRGRPKAALQGVFAAHPARLVQTRDLRACQHQKHVVIFCGTTELDGILALVVGALDLERLQLTFADLRPSNLRVGDASCNEDEV